MAYSKKGLLDVLALINCAFHSDILNRVEKDQVVMAARTRTLSFETESMLQVKLTEYPGCELIMGILSYFKEGEKR